MKITFHLVIKKIGRKIKRMMNIELKV